MHRKTGLTHLVLCLLMVLAVLLGTVLVPSAASTTCSNMSGDNYEDQNYSKWAKPEKSYIISLSNGGFLRFQAGATSTGYVVQYLNSSYKVTSQKTVVTELPKFGAFFASGSNYYIISGQNNTSEKSSTEVYRITKYDTNWKRLTSLGIKNCNTTKPFDAGSCQVTSSGNYLFIRTCHEMYETSDGINHQANVQLVVNMKTMKLMDSMTKIKNQNYGYMSHSFNQFLRVDNGVLYGVDHGDAYPRGISLVAYQNTVSDGTFSGKCYTKTTMTFSGKAGANVTGASLGGFELSSKNCIIAGNTVVQGKGGTTRNIFVTVTGRSSNGKLGSTTTRKITSYAEGSTSASTPQLVKLSSDSFLLLWSRSGKVYFVKLDGNGKTTTKIHSFTGKLSDCQPILKSGKVIWYTYSGNSYAIHEVNASKMTARVVNSTTSTSSTTSTTKTTTSSSTASTTKAATTSSTATTASTSKNVTLTRYTASDRYQTSIAVANAMKTKLGVSQFSNIIVASGTGYADALSGSYLGYVKKAPILLVDTSDSSTVTLITNYIKNNLASGGTVYVLGSTSAVGDTFESTLGEGYNVTRLAGATRYDTNLEILKASGTSLSDCIVCSGTNYPDSLSAAAARKPILLVGDSLTDSQKAYLSDKNINRLYIVGSTSTVSDATASAVKAYATASERLYGATRYETSTAVANRLYGTSISALTLVTGTDFPDGLCAGPLAAICGTPLVLTNNSDASAAIAYGSKTSATTVTVVGSTSAVSDATAKSVLG